MLSLDLRSDVFGPFKCALPGRRCNTLPLAVTLYRFAADFLVFILPAEIRKVARFVIYLYVFAGKRPAPTLLLKVSCAGVALK
jgi:hypothetical protein